MATVYVGIDIHPGAAHSVEFLTFRSGRNMGIAERTLYRAKHELKNIIAKKMPLILAGLGGCATRRRLMRHAPRAMRSPERIQASA
jgi:hypothetical protein